MVPVSWLSSNCGRRLRYSRKVIVLNKPEAHAALGSHDQTQAGIRTSCQKRRAENSGRTPVAQGYNQGKSKDRSFDEGNCAEPGASQMVRPRHREMGRV